MKKLFFFLITSAIISSASAYPISPRPLRRLVIESELIAWVKVIKTGKSVTPYKVTNPWESEYALLVVHEVLQRKLMNDTLKVYYTSRMICPEPGVFYENEMALAFLDKAKTGDSYQIHALSYGVKHKLNPGDYQVYKTRIKEMQDILAMTGSEKKDELTLEWLVKCAEQKCTRWDGVYELSPYNNLLSFYELGEKLKKDVSPNSTQLCRLFDALLKTDTIDQVDLGLAEITKGVNDALLLIFLKSKLQRANDEYHWAIGGIMQRIVKLTGDKKLEPLYEQFIKGLFEYPDLSKEKRKIILSEFIIQMKDIELKVNLAAPENLST